MTQEKNNGHNIGEINSKVNKNKDKKEHKQTKKNNLCPHNKGIIKKRCKSTSGPTGAARFQEKEEEKETSELRNGEAGQRNGIHGTGRHHGGKKSEGHGRRAAGKADNQKATTERCCKTDQSSRHLW